MQNINDQVDLVLPARWSSACIFSSPHSGSDYPAQLLERTHLSMAQLRSSEDAFVDELFSAAPACGAPLICAKLPRAWVDLNRGANEFDSALITGVPPTPRAQRVNAGLGVIPRVVAEGRAIVHGRMSREDAETRIERDYRPYHDLLGALIVESREKFGSAILIDCHSMPHDALASAPLVRNETPQIVLGDRFGASCDRWVIEMALECFNDAGFRVIRNAPFAGGFITQHYGKPSQNVHALQIEIDRSLYMNEREIEHNAGFEDVQKRLSRVIRRLSKIGGTALPIAAE